MIPIRQATDKKIKDLLDSIGAFFAFSDNQFEEAKKTGVTYCSVGNGLLTPIGSEKKLVSEMSAIYAESRKLDLELNGKESIIRRELFNYESFYIGDIEDAVDALKVYEITEDEVKEAFTRIRKTEDV